LLHLLAPRKSRISIIVLASSRVRPSKVIVINPDGKPLESATEEGDWIVVRRIRWKAYLPSAKIVPKIDRLFLPAIEDR
jgi:hypothetical protein